MIVYVVCQRPAYSEDEHWQNYGVFSTREFAEEYLATQDENDLYGIIEEWLIDEGEVDS